MKGAINYWWGSTGTHWREAHIVIVCASDHGPFLKHFPVSVAFLYHGFQASSKSFNMYFWLPQLSNLFDCLYSYPRHAWPVPFHEKPRPCVFCGHQNLSDQSTSMEILKSVFIQKAHPLYCQVPKQLSANLIPKENKWRLFILLTLLAFLKVKLEALTKTASLWIDSLMVRCVQTEQDLKIFEHRLLITVEL